MSIEINPLFHWRKSVHKAALCTAVSLCLTVATGCLRHSISGPLNTYHFRDIGGVTVLEPPLNPQGDTGQWVGTVTLTGHPRLESITENDERCSIQTSLFSFAPGKVSGRWIVKSPRAENWAVSATQELLAPDWMRLLVGLTRLEQSGCFPAEESTYSVQRAIVSAIPIPADQSLLFFYRLADSGYVDLQPGLELRVVWPNSSSGKPGSEKEPLSHYQVLARPSTGVQLQILGRNEERQKGTSSYVDLPQAFGPYSLLRLFLEQGETDKSAPRMAALLGALTSEALDGETKVLLRDGSKPCGVTLPSSRCVVFPQGAVSLLASVNVNGKALLYGPGTTLGQLIDALPDAVKERVFATVSVQRSANLGYANLIFKRDAEAASKVILINGDRIRWRR